MNQQELEKALANLNLGGIRYYDSIGSTNDEALAWAKNGAREYSIVVADEQTRGRGRSDRTWLTPRRSALALSVIIRLTRNEKPYLTRTVGLAALALADALQMLSLDPQIKWPNDILLNDKKAAGILTELAWMDDDVSSIVIGVGVNVAKISVPNDGQLHFPAISLEHILGEIPNRTKLIHAVLANIMALRPHLATDSFIHLWEKKLAFLGRQVQVEERGEVFASGTIHGLESDGSLRLSNDDGKSMTVHFGDVRLRLSA